MKNALLLLFCLSTLSLFAQFPSSLLQLNKVLTDSFTVVEVMPRFPGCENMTAATDKEKKKCAEQKMLDFIYTHIKYPAVAAENGVEGMTVVNFIVEKDGSISNIRLKKDIGAGCGLEAVRVVKLMNNLQERWTPGIVEGEPVRVSFNLPIRFKLEGDSFTESPIEPAQETEGIYFEPLVDTSKLSPDDKFIDFLYEGNEFPYVFFCRDFAGEFYKKEFLQSIPTLEFKKEWCLKGLDFEYISVSYEKNGETIIKITDETWTPKMADLFTKAASGDAYVIQFMVKDGSEERIRILMVE